MVNITRSRFGCLTCRKRKVKCDETLPSCKRCTDTGRKCDGPAKTKFRFVEANSPKSTVTQPKQLISPTLALHNFEANEVRAFDYFLNCAAPCLAATQDDSFWTNLVPRIIQYDPAPRHAVLAISTLFEHPRLPAISGKGEETLAETHPQALRWHSQSMREFNDCLQLKSSKEKIELALLSCVLLTTIEFQQGHLQNALVLLKYGTDMATTVPSDMSNDIAKVIKGILVPIFARQTVLMAASGRVPSKDWFERFHCTDSNPARGMLSLIDARVGLFNCLWGATKFVYVASTNMSIEADTSKISGLQKEKATVMQQLANWDKEFFLFAHPRRNKTPFEHLTITTMIMYFNVVYIWASSFLAHPNDVWSGQDLLCARFKRIVQCAEVLLQPASGNMHIEPPTPFSFQTGVGPALLFVVSRCRDESVRGKALVLLNRDPGSLAICEIEKQACAIEQAIKGTVVACC